MEKLHDDAEPYSFFDAEFDWPEVQSQVMPSLTLEKIERSMDAAFRFAAKSAFNNVNENSNKEEIPEMKNGQQFQILEFQHSAGSLRLIAYSGRPFWLDKRLCSTIGITKCHRCREKKVKVSSIFNVISYYSVSTMIPIRLARDAKWLPKPAPLKRKLH